MVHRGFVVLFKCYFALSPVISFILAFLRSFRMCFFDGFVVPLFSCISTFLESLCSPLPMKTSNCVNSFVLREHKQTAQPWSAHYPLHILVKNHSLLQRLSTFFPPPPAAFRKPKTAAFPRRFPRPRRSFSCGEDYLNFRYHDKRAAYLGEVQRQLHSLLMRGS